MNRASPAVFALFALLLSCGMMPDRHHFTLQGAGGEELAPFLHGLRNRAAFSEHPALRAAPFYRLELSVDESLTRVSGLESLRYTNGSSRYLDRLDFVLLPNIVPGSMEIARLAVDGTELRPRLSPDGMVLHALFPRRLAPGGNVGIEIRYTLTVPQSTAVGFGGLELHDGILSLAYAYPMVPASGRWDYGRPPAWGDLTANPVSFYAAEVSYPRGLLLAAPGGVLRHTMREGRAADQIAFGPARDFYLELGRGLEVVRGESGGVELRAIVPASARASAAAVIATAGRALSFYEHLFGPYPYRSLTFVSSRFGALGLEFPGIIVLASPLFGDPNSTIGGAPVRVLREATVAHEVAHQWFYALVGNDQLAEPWIDEAFAQYATLRYELDRCDEQGAQGFLRSRAGAPAAAQPPIGGPVSSYTPREYGSVIYGRGPLFLQALSARLGRPQFDRFVRRLIEEYSWRTITGEEIRLAAEQSCGCSLEELWREWVLPAKEPLPAGTPVASDAASAR